MHILDIFQAHPTTFSFEFFPPKTDEASDELFADDRAAPGLAAVVRLGDLRRGGSTRERTHDLIVRIQRETDLTAVSHLTCVCHTARRAGGDPRPLRRLGDREHPRPRRRPAPRPGRLRPRRTTPSSTPTDLVRFIKSRTDRADPRGFGVGVAGFPEGHPGTPEPAQGDGLPQARRSTPGPTTSAPSSSSTTTTSTTSASAASWPASTCRSSPGSCRSPRRRAWPGWPTWPWGPVPRRAC